MMTQHLDLAGGKYHHIAFSYGSENRNLVSGRPKHRRCPIVIGLLIYMAPKPIAHGVAARWTFS